MTDSDNTRTDGTGLVRPLRFSARKAPAVRD